MRVSVFGAAGLAAALGAVAARAQTPPPNPVPASAPARAAEKPAPPIIGIRVIGYQTVTPDTIAHYLGIKVGDPYDPEKIRGNFQSLWDVGLLENVTIEAETAPAGVTLVVSIEERPMISAVEYQGNKKLSVSQIKDRLKEQKVDVKAGAPLSLRDIAKVRAVIADYYTEQGFRSASVDYRVEDVSKTEKKVVFAIDEGDKIKIAAIHFTGNKAVSERTLRNAMKKTKVNVFWRLLSESTTYSQANFEADVELIKGVYQSKGYKDIVVKDPILDVFVKNPKADPKKFKRQVRIAIPVVEGDQFFAGEIRIVKMDQSGQPEAEGQPMVVARERML
ncbi:MAG: POTRA domain-containing protein, partial [Thermoanaerobaculia bacterium]